MKKGLALITFLYLSCSLLAQKPDTLIKKLDSLSKRTDSAGGQVNNTKPAAYNESTKITFQSYFILLGSDIKQAFTKPFHMTKQDWITTGKFALVAGGLSLLDEPIQHKALQIRNNSSTLRSI